MADDEVYLDVAHRQDAAKVLALLRLLQVESEMFTVSPEFATLTVNDEAENIEQINQTTDNLILLAWENATPIGIITVSHLSHTGDGELGIAVRRSYWHQGLGTALMDEALNWGRHYSSLERLVLDVLVKNVHAIGLYQKMGFKIVDQIEVIKNSQPFPALRMEIQL